MKKTALFSGVLVSIFAAAPTMAGTFALHCTIEGAGSIQSTSPRDPPPSFSSKKIVAKYLVSTDSQSVTLESRSGTKTVRGRAPGPVGGASTGYFEDVRVLTDAQLVFCEDDRYGCRFTEVPLDHGGTTQVDRSPVIINLNDGSIRYQTKIVVIRNGSAITLRDDYSGSCVRS